MSNFVEILRFKHYVQKVYLIPEGKNYRNKVVKNHILVWVVLYVCVIKGRHRNIPVLEKSTRNDLIAVWFESPTLFFG